MNMDKNDFCRTVNWYPLLGEHTALTGFLKLSADDLNLLAGGISGGKEVRNIISRIKKVMRGGSFDYYFVSTDVCAPTDTERFAAKRGAVHSAESAWRFLAASAKVRQAAADGNVEYLVFRPFIKIDKTREFRLFIYNGELKAMSQYNLIRHYRRLEKIKNNLWKTVDNWFEQVRLQLPVENLCMDIYLDDDDKSVNIIDLNPWGEPTDALLLRSFDRDWSKCEGIKLMLPPTKISGDVAVSF